MASGMSAATSSLTGVPKRRLMSSIFFFSSRRRHTRCGRDWSSDVCSSDLFGRRAWPRRAPGARGSRCERAYHHRCRLGRAGAGRSGRAPARPRFARTRAPPRGTVLVLLASARVRPGEDRSPLPGAARGVAAAMRSGERTEGRKGADGPAAIPFPSFRPSIAVSLLLVTACQPQARRLLVLDLALSDPVVVSGTAEPWRDAGYTVEYRQFYPHLARTDLARYRVLIFLLGREPEAPSDALTTGDLALLNEWVRAGGVGRLGHHADRERYLHLLSRHHPR